MSPLRSGLGPLEPKWREIFCFTDLIHVPEDGLEIGHTLCAQHFQIGLLSVASDARWSLAPGLLPVVADFLVLSLQA